MNYPLITKIGIVFILVTIGITFCSCITLKSHELNVSETININELSPRYFGSWSGYQIPFVPKEPLSKEEAEKRDSYYIGYYNPDQKLRVFQKYLADKLEWNDEYFYWDNGNLRMRIMTKSDGTKTIQHFDQRGRIIKDN